jgi:hypothetical protein
MDQALTSEAEVFTPNRSARIFGQCLLLGVGALAGVGAWVVFGLKNFQHAVIVSACGGVLALAMIVAALTDILRGRNLKVCLGKDTLSVTDYSSEEKVELSEITEVIDSVESTVIATRHRKIVVDDAFFRSTDDKARFLKLLRARLTQ